MSNNSDQQNKPPVSKEALAWAEFLYEEYMQSKHKQFLSSSKRKTMDLDKKGSDE